MVPRRSYDAVIFTSPSSTHGRAIRFPLFTSFITDLIICCPFYSLSRPVSHETWQKSSFLGFFKISRCETHKMIVYKIMDTQITAMKEITKQMQGSIIFVKRDELNASDSRQSEIFQNEQNRKRNISSSVTDITFVHDENLKKLFWSVRIGLRHENQHWMDSIKRLFSSQHYLDTKFIFS